MSIGWKGALLTLTAVGMVIAGLGLFAGATGGAPNGATPTAAASSGASTGTVSTGTFNFSSPAPVWNSGNLCTVQKVGSYWSCSYSGPSHHHHGYGPAVGVTSNCGCSVPTPLIYNFTMRAVTLNITLSNLSDQVPIFINIKGNWDTINIVITGSDCQGQGGILNVTVLGENNDINFVNHASGVSASFLIYLDKDVYTATFYGNHDSTSTYFVGASPRYGLCPWENRSRLDTAFVSFVGWADHQSLEWVNGVGYNTPTTWQYVGGWSSVSYGNTSTFSCYWSFPPAYTCSQGWGPSQVLVAGSRD